MQPSVFQTAECGIKTQKFLQGERRKTILGELCNKVSGREIERTFKLKTDINSSHIATTIYAKLKDLPNKVIFSLLEVGIIHSIIIQTQYELNEHEQSFKTKITVNSYGKEQVAVKIKSPSVRKHKKVKVKEERKFFIPYIDGKKPESDIQNVLEENIPIPIQEMASWKKEKYQLFVEYEQNIFTIAISQIYMLQDEGTLIELQSKSPLRKIEVEYQGTQYSELSGNIPTEEGEKLEEQDSIMLEVKLEKEISRQIRKITRRVREICENELCLPLSTV